MVYFGRGDEGARCETRNLAEHGNMAERIESEVAMGDLIQRYSDWMN